MKAVVFTWDFPHVTWVVYSVYGDIADVGECTYYDYTRREAIEDVRYNLQENFAIDTLRVDRKHHYTKHDFHR